ncbi:hypothetical protein F4777DRAFT_491808 [Nemania sp. FL0916]|nr:hypothetical protein F4777DRAFT_491808 [Nemania sp. FL0916]
MNREQEANEQSHQSDINNLEMAYFSTSSLRSRITLYKGMFGKTSKFPERITIHDDIDDDDDDNPPSPLESFKISDYQLFRQHQEIPISYSIPRCRSRQEPTIHQEIRSETLHRWRDSDTDMSQIRDASCDYPRNRDSSDSSGSESCSPSNKRPRDVSAHLKYLVRGFLRRLRASSPVIDVGTEKKQHHECFVPSPKVTFLLDDPRNLMCQICQLQTLKMGITAEDPRSNSTAILPCGHIYCYSCINSWLTMHSSCPFCRTETTRKACVHRVQPRVIAQDTIHTLPATLAEGGKIADLCIQCADKDRRKVSLQRWLDSAENFRKARREAEMLGTDDAREKMRKAKKAFEQVPLDDHSGLTWTRLHRW